MIASSRITRAVGAGKSMGNAAESAAETHVGAEDSVQAPAGSQRE
jgi:hypothetical protein